MSWLRTAPYAVFIIVLVAFIPWPDRLILAPSDPLLFSVPHAGEAAPVTVLFVGDIMLGRQVETYMEQKGPLYPFAGTQHLLSGTTLTVGNFEGAIPENHRQTPSLNTVFSIRASYMDVLKSVGFDILSLANNHSGDGGIDAFEHTRKVCVRAEMVCKGIFEGLTEESVYIYETEDRRTGFLFLHTLFTPPREEEVRAYMEELNRQSDVQVAYVHWGTEYALTHNAEQEQLAHALVDAGADAVIGHHPHVIQDVEIYKNAPIFYSLGNFIFDQYFSRDVQEGLMVTMRISSSTLTFNTTVVTSAASRAQPHLASNDVHVRVYDRIFSRFETDVRVSKEKGAISVSY